MLSSSFLRHLFVYLKMKSLVFVFFLFLAAFTQAQSDTTKTKQILDSINRRLDRSVVNKDVAFMQKHYADDFFFYHATGMIDSKKSWIGKAESSNNMNQSREHDSLIVELHDDVAILKGILTVRLKPEANRPNYFIRYIRVFALRKNTWQLISHHSTAQWN
jgi:ketosteroid isomerase-like protein